MNLGILIQNEAAIWLELNDRKQWSRLLYTNPVCFLCCCASSPDATSPGERPGRNNVMVLSWLTATNNTGQFVFSLNRRRHTASLLLQNEGETPSSPSPLGTLFTLSVPVQGMEDIVRSVGQVSGKQINKFTTTSAPCSLETGSSQLQSNRRKKKLLSEEGYIPGLMATSAKCSLSYPVETSLLCIEGTVSHMVCRVQQVLETNSDSDHWLVVAQVEAASVLSSYWDAEKSLFRPALGAPPYFSFFGSQTFGYVVTADHMDRWSGQQI